jgi:antitoxin ParD1/3/4
MILWCFETKSASDAILIGRIATLDRMGLNWENRRMPTRNVNLTEHFDRFIETGIKTGRFSNASEVVREGLRLLEQREQEDKAKLEWLRAAAKEGFDAARHGDYVALKSVEELDDFLDRIHEEVSAELTAERKRG